MARMIKLCTTQEITNKSAKPKDWLMIDAHIYQCESCKKCVSYTYPLPVGQHCEDCTLCRVCGKTQYAKGNEHTSPTLGMIEISWYYCTLPRPQKKQNGHKSAHFYVPERRAKARA